MGGSGTAYIPTRWVTNILSLGWRKSIDDLSAVSGIDVNGYPAYISALEERRAFFKSMGATATDQGITTVNTGLLSPSQAEVIFQHALHGEVSEREAVLFSGHMLIEWRG